MIGFFYAMKVCSKCRLDRELIDFYKNKKGKDGLSNRCKYCDKQYRLDNKELIIKANNIWRENNKEHIKQYYFKNLENKKQYRKEYNLKNPEYSRQYRLNNRKLLSQKAKVYIKNKRLTDPLFKLNNNISTLIRQSIKNNGFTKRSKTYEILGCSYEEFKKYLESKFTEGMTWENQGKWHMDHIYPVSLATDEEHLIRLNHYTNFQPLWAKDNLIKSNKI